MPSHQSLPPAADIPSSGKFILLGEDDVDDEELLLEVFSTIDTSYSLTFVNNGRKLAATIRAMPDNHLPCLIVLDYNMPELNGADILRELQNDRRYDSIPKIIWSTSGSDTYKNLCLTLGASDYIIKPSSVKGLTEAARYMLSFCSAH